MSINSMVNVAMARRADFPPMNAVPEGLNEIAAAAGAGVPTSGGAAGAPSASATDTALHVLFGYVPTEVLTLYLAVVAALQPSLPTSLPASSVPPGSLAAFLLFLSATPVVVWVVFAGKLRGAGKDLPLKPALWPFWEMSAGAIAFAAWALALPNNPFTGDQWYKPSFAAITVLIASTVLGLLALLFTRPLKSP
jgi:hypothetical protein